MLEIVSLLLVALLFGGMLLYSLGFAAVLFSTLPAAMARATLRRAFPHFYLFVIVTAALAALLLWPQDRTSATLLGLIALSTLPTRQLLMPAINAATDDGRKARFKWLHGLSVLVSLAHIAVSGVVLARFV
ncbi:MAG: DUF4149 domain-containing protein [Methyloversatilis discipulorum]|uniref:DUF4149 domain-containing protein n=1 Tax=Methyloversatilis discipulorum TaxID=1119528 RepID=UPI0026E98574|nr:DUF4149 domain-containing protein [Methyloversatilis discipulorum]MBV5287739.1 DUF4149 domain-containing protein [Methyloversatilis discipulorum]